ncbi:MAG TPA: hypothetical protein VK892_11625 [Pyrinomonadaceae bacterium]|nr:hypothetical protein [Pyrinomonadaceae bacterium]
MKNLQKLYIFGAIAVISLIASGCGIVNSAVENVSSIVGLNETGTVIAKRAQIRSSYAVVAADLLEVKRGETLDILEETDFEKVRWFRVRAHDEDQTEGWIEAQNIILGEILEKSKELAQEGKDSPTQAMGQLRAASNLRLLPEQNPENILLKLENGSTFEIVSWKYVPKQQDVADVDDAQKGEETKKKSGSKNAEIEAAKESNEPEKLEEKYDIWYQVRLDPSQSPAPAGWLFGRQVELQVPSDILFYQQNNKKFVAWHRLDNPDTNVKSSSKDTVQVGVPGSWVVLTRSNQVKAVDGVEPDFDGILVWDYDKYSESHQMVYRNNDVWGHLPLKVEGTGDNKSFILNLRNPGGQMEEKRFVVFKDKNRLRVKPPEGLGK